MRALICLDITKFALLFILTETVYPKISVRKLLPKNTLSLLSVFIPASLENAFAKAPQFSPRLNLNQMFYPPSENLIDWINRISKFPNVPGIIQVKLK